MEDRAKYALAIFVIALVFLLFIFGIIWISSYLYPMGLGPPKNNNNKK